MFRTVLLIFCFTLFSATSFYAQDEKAEKDSVEESSDFDFHFNDNFDFDFDFNFSGENYKAPTVTINYGQSHLSGKGFAGSFADNKLLELKLGYTTEKNYRHSESITKYRYRYLFLSNFSDMGKSNNLNSKLETEMWRFGIVTSTGYGYRLGEASITPYHSGALVWSRIDFDNQSALPADMQTINLYDEIFRFGQSAEGGVRFKVISNIVLEAGYERSLIFPRHLFWKWAMSGIIELAAQGLVDGFVNEIMKSSPVAGPIMSFILKNGLSYGIYELRQKKMNWPFDSTEPLAYDQFKVGLTFIF